MMAVALPGILAAAVAGAAAPEYPEIQFVQSSQTGLHVALQPFDDHYRIYFLAQVGDWAGRQVFARIRCEAGPGQPGGGHEWATSTIVEVETDDDVWAFSFRVPKFRQWDAAYQVEVGPYRPYEVNDLDVQGGKVFAWEVARDQAGDADIRDTRPDGSRISLPTWTKVPIIEGGQVRVTYRDGVGYPPPRPVPLEFGVVEAGPMDGERMVRRVN
ncbi:hypothetical protein [Tautonia plasticadhaerens]|uniref:Carbohydrate-binding domain-containing protein n=1 Tax=Tautonia plasticadhaerens TaxID=2527974 RepID=A0A518H0Y7_9BACT|nr:hypothetical protein [Tautonia plasticadhaerens]QDV34519.1 hypothetical protein ElP_24090 [Tautonia plasticadhaerens]